MCVWNFHFAMSKRKAVAQDDDVPAGVRLKHDVDAMGFLILQVVQDNKTLNEKLNYLKNQVKRLKTHCANMDGYITEMEMRNEVLESTIKSVAEESRMTKDLVLDITANKRANGECVEDLERIINELETEDEDNAELFGSLWEEWEVDIEI